MKKAQKRPTEKEKDLQFLQKTCKRLRKRPTGAEVEFRRKLDSIGESYIFQNPFYYRGYKGRNIKIAQILLNIKLSPEEQHLRSIAASC